MQEIVQTIYSNSGKRRVVFFQRDDKFFGFDEEHFSENELEMCWISSRRNSSFFDTLQTAQREIYSRVDWLLSRENREF